MRKLAIILFALFTLTAGIPAAIAAPQPRVITVAGHFSEGSAEADALVAELEAVASAKVQIEYSNVEPHAIAALISGPNPPDIVLGPQAGQLLEGSDHLVDLGDVVNPNKLRKDYGDYLIDAGSTGSMIAAAPIRADLKSLVWYQPAFFDTNGYDIPTSFDELVALSDEMVADGNTPWCNYIESGPATGWVGTDWIEDLLLGAEGAAAYDEWVTHEILFSDARVETAFERYEQMINTPGYVFDRANMLTVSFSENAAPLMNQDCGMHRQGSFFEFFLEGFGADLADFDTFAMPSVDEAHTGATVGGASYIAMVNNRPEVRKVVRGALSNRFGTNGLVEAGVGWLVPNTHFNTATYDDDLKQKWAEQYVNAVEADLFRADASDEMPPDVGAGTFWLGVAELVAGLKTVSQVLTDIDTSWPS